MAETSATIEGAEHVWIATRCFAEDTDLAGLASPIDSRRRAEDRLVDLLAKAIEESPIFVRWNRLWEALDLPSNFDQLKPAARAGAIRACGAPDHLVC